MKKLNILLTILVVFTTSLFILTAALNIASKSEEVYSYYFNDTRAVDKIYTDYTANEMAREISGFMKSWKPESFDIKEDTGYDMQSIFDDNEGYNMMCVKKVVDINFVVLIASLILTVGIYYFLLKKDKKSYLRLSYKISMPISILLIAGTFYVLRTQTGQSMVMEKLGMLTLGEESQLAMLIGSNFVSMASIFFLGLAVVILIAVSYVALLITKPPRIFF